MKNIFKRLFLFFSYIFVSIFISACTPKITIQALEPSKISSQKVNIVAISNIKNDNVNQTTSIANALSNKIIDDKNVFTIQNNTIGVDAIINGEVLNSSASYNVYYHEEIDFSRCRYFRYDEKAKTKQCLQYEIRYIPCETKYYNVTTALNLVNPNTNNIIFSKTYDKSSSDNVCYDRYFSYSPIFPSHLNSRSDSFRVNSQIAFEIAKDFVNDISPNYIYFNVEIIDELKDYKNYTKEQNERFKTAVSYLEKSQFDIAFSILESLDIELNGKSYEVAYNLGLIFEARDELEIANKLYFAIKDFKMEIKHKNLIDYGINRTNLNLQNKIKAKSQLK
ncbi:hypothetical protein [Arcobacter vandammei]|uniref:hypothetical protein n=1 Tax=Arcobacter vandammei TaxID=2782243 RepID=UPI0018DFCEC1|nr:hypothetical protein [Arcobacter vandammei]